LGIRLAGSCCSFTGQVSTGIRGRAAPEEVGSTARGAGRGERAGAEMLAAGGALVVAGAQLVPQVAGGHGGLVHWGSRGEEAGKRDGGRRRSGGRRLGGQSWAARPRGHGVRWLRDERD
jgi:hypothetical protein